MGGKLTRGQLEELKRSSSLLNAASSAKVHAEEHLHPNKRKVLNRLARIEGHVRSIRTMVDSNRDCSEVLIQIAAVRKALDNTAKVILRDHLEHCILHAVTDGDGRKSLDDFEIALDRYLR